MRLVRELLRPYRGWLLIIFAAMLAQTAMSLAAPWPLKIVIDNAVAGHKVIGPDIEGGGSGLRARAGFLDSTRRGT